MTNHYHRRNQGLKTMSQLNLADAQNILQRAVQRASELKVNACISIVDAGAHLLAFQRMDGAALGPIDVCQRKARTSALFQCNSGDFGTVIEQDQLIGMEATNGGLAAFHGGVPIKAEGKVIGAIGVSGGSAEQDNIIALYALNEES